MINSHFSYTWGRGIHFSGETSGDNRKAGGAVLDKGSNFGVEGFSEPNFLCFNGTAQYANRTAFVYHHPDTRAMMEVRSGCMFSSLFAAAM